MLRIGMNGQSMFPWDLPIWSPDYTVFFGVFYLVLLVIGLGLGIVFLKSLKDFGKEDH